MRILSDEPIIIGEFKLDPQEMMLVQYMPIKMPWSREIRIPENLKVFEKLVDAVGPVTKHYVYLTAKRSWVSPERHFNRDGWHTDGFGTNDLNIIWYDKDPTEFAIQEFHVSDDHEESMVDMEIQAIPEAIKTYPLNSLLLLTPDNVHRVAKVTEPGFRTFVKISISDREYNLKGNAHNYLFDYDWKMYDRELKRNHPIKEIS